MPFSDWRSYIAIGGIVTLACAASYFSPWITRFAGSDVHSASHTQTGTGEQPGTSSAPPQVKPRPPATEHKPDCSKPEDADLCAQMRMAEAAEQQEIINWLGLALLFGTLIFTGWAAVSARRAASVGHQTLEHMERADRVQLRAYVFMNNVNSHWIAKKEGEEITHWVFTPVWKNSGQTPTVGALTNVTFALTTGAVTPEDIDFADDTPEPSSSIYAPGAIMHATPFRVDIATLQSIRAGERRFFVWGWIEYNDVFSGTPRHRHEFCFEVLVVGNPIYKEGGFAYPRYGRFNGHESECYRQPQTPSVERV